MVRNSSHRVTDCAPVRMATMHAHHSVLRCAHNYYLILVNVPVYYPIFSVHFFPSLIVYIMIFSYDAITKMLEFFSYKGIKTCKYDNDTEHACHLYPTRRSACHQEFIAKNHSWCPLKAAAVKSGHVLALTLCPRNTTSSHYQVSTPMRGKVLPYSIALDTDLVHLLNLVLFWLMVWIRLSFEFMYIGSQPNVYVYLDAGSVVIICYLKLNFETI